MKSVSFKLSLFAALSMIAACGTEGAVESQASRTEASGQAKSACYFGITGACHMMTKDECGIYDFRPGVACTEPVKSACYFGFTGVCTMLTEDECGIYEFRPGDKCSDSP